MLPAHIPWLPTLLPDRAPGLWLCPGEAVAGRMPQLLLQAWGVLLSYTSAYRRAYSSGGPHPGDVAFHGASAPAPTGTLRTLPHIQMNAR